MNIQFILYPIIALRRYLINNTSFGMWYLKRRLSKTFELRFNRKLDWENPKDLNEKIQWLKFNSDISLWSEYSDKYKVRQYVEKCGYRDTLVKLYGVWGRSEDINFDELPNSFVLKTNNWSGTVLIVTDKSKLDIKNTRRLLNKWLRLVNNVITFEIQYTKIKPLIIAEELLSCERQDCNSSSLIDYKVWCFNGEPYSIWVYYDRNKKVKKAIYDLNWQLHQEDLVPNDHFAYDVHPNIPKPKIFDEMVNCARKLSEGFPEVRVDFYIIDNHLYFGEMTFTSSGGLMKSVTQGCLLKMGEAIKLPK